MPPTGQLVLDKGATKAVVAKSSLFAAGVKEVMGTFQAYSVVSLLDPERKEIGRGLVNYSSIDMAKIASKSSDEFEVRNVFHAPASAWPKPKPKP